MHASAPSWAPFRKTQKAYLNVETHLDEASQKQFGFCSAFGDLDQERGEFLQSMLVKESLYQDSVINCPTAK